MLADLIIGAIVLLFMIIYLSGQLRGFFETRFENRWKRELQLAREYVESPGLDMTDLRQADAVADRLGSILGLRVTIIAPDGKVMGDSRVPSTRLRGVESHADRPEVQQALQEGFGETRRYSTTVNQNLFYLAVPVDWNHGNRSILRIAVPTSEIDEFVSRIQNLIWLASGLAFLLVLVASFVVSKYITDRMHEMSLAARRFARGDFSRRVAENGSDELADLSLALNQMAADLQRNMTQITQERDQLHAILNSMVEGVMVSDNTGKILLTNHSFELIFHVHKPIIGQSIREVFRDAQLLTALEKAIQEKKDTVVTLELLSPIKKSLEAHIAILAPKDAESGVVAVFHDITKLQHLEQVRRDFVANVSHELRTPLTAIKGYVETLLDTDAIETDKQQLFLETVLRHSDRMAKLVEDLLSLSKLESIEPGEELQLIDLTTLCRRVAENFSNILEKSNIHLNLELADDVSPVRGLPGELESALANLIDNAIKYGSSGGEITVSVEELADKIKVSVKDAGIGIPTDDQPRIFERFYRVDKGRSRELGGTGLGLSIVKHIIQRHNGRIWVESVVGKGACFSFVLPKVAEEVFT